MYYLLLILLLITATFIVVRGMHNNRSVQTGFGLALGIGTLLFFWFMGFWGEKLWFDALGYNDRFWTVWMTKIILLVVAAVAGGAIVYLLTIGMSPDTWAARKVAVATGAILSGLWWFGQWEVFLRFSHRVRTGTTEPVLNLDSGFYLFTYPFLQALYSHLFVLTLFALGAAAVQYVYISQKTDQTGDHRQNGAVPGAIYLSGGALLLVLGLGKYVDRYDVDGSYSQVMVSAREMLPANLPEKSQTFVNKHFKYTHGYGAVLNRVNEFTPDGLPNFLIQDIPPVSAYDNLTIDRPEVYYGELSGDFVVVNSEEKEFAKSGQALDRLQNALQQLYEKRQTTDIEQD